MEGPLMVDGSAFEGGGQILRVAVCLSIIKQRPVQIFNIRAGRPKPGLAHSHLTALNLLAKISSSQLEGGVLGSSQIVFTPGTPVAGEYECDCGTAGSISLMLQAILPILIRLDSLSVIRFTGGTDVSHSPPSHFISKVLIPRLTTMGIQLSFDISQYGFYPRGGGKVQVVIHPSAVNPIDLTEPPPPFTIKAKILMTPTKKRGKGMTDHEYISALSKSVQYHTGISAGKVKVREVNAMNRGLVLNLWGKTENDLILHSSEVETFGKKVNPQQLAETVCTELEKQIQRSACVDDYLQDQLLIFMAMAPGLSRIKIHELTLHSQAVIDLLHRFDVCRVTVEDDIITVYPLNADN